MIIKNLGTVIAGYGYESGSRGGLVSQAPNANELTPPLISELCNSRTVRDTAAFLDIVETNNQGEATFKGIHSDLSFLKQLDNAPKKYHITSLLVELGHNEEEITPTILAKAFTRIVKAFLFNLYRKTSKKHRSI